MGTIKTFAIATLGIFSCVSSIFAAEKPVKMQDLPAGVQKAVQEQTAGAQIKGLSKEIEKGKTTYEVETTINGHSRDLSFNASGNLLEVEEETTLEAIPVGAKTAIEKKAAGGKVTKVETVTRGTTVSYDAAITKAGKKSEFSVAPDGSPVK